MLLKVTKYRENLLIVALLFSLCDFIFSHSNSRAKLSELIQVNCSEKKFFSWHVWVPKKLMGTLPYLLLFTWKAAATLCKYFIERRNENISSSSMAITLSLPTNVQHSKHRVPWHYMTEWTKSCKHKNLAVIKPSGFSSGKIHTQKR